MLRFERTVSADVDASPARCLEVLGAIEGYPGWARLVGGVEVLAPGRVRMRVHVLGLTVHMDCAIEVAERAATLRRMPFDAADDERYEARFAIAPNRSGGSHVELRVEAAIDAPGPAGLLRGRVARHLADDLLKDFAAAV